MKRDYRAGEAGVGRRPFASRICDGDYEEVAGNREHMVSTEPEFSPNDLKLMSAVNKNYFVKQYMKMGLFVSGANLPFVDEAEGREESGKLEMAIKGNCGSVR